MDREASLPAASHRPETSGFWQRGQHVLRGQWSPEKSLKKAMGTVLREVSLLSPSSSLPHRVNTQTPPHPRTRAFEEHPTAPGGGRWRAVMVTCLQHCQSCALLGKPAGVRPHGGTVPRAVPRERVSPQRHGLPQSGRGENC